MKKYILCVLLIITTLITASLPTYAVETVSEASGVQMSDGSTVITYEDGSKLTITTEVTEEAPTTRATALNQYAKKTAEYEESDGTLAWTFTLNATFSYVYATSATCTDASYSYTIEDDGWSFSSGSATKSGNKATATGTFKFKVLFITTETQKPSLTLTCDIYGNVT